MLDIAQQQIIERSQHPLFSGPLAEKTHVAMGANLSCGDEISFEALLDHDKVMMLKHQCRACAICTASADLLVEFMQGKPLSALQNYDAAATLGIPLSPVRLKCALLPIETLKTLKQA